MIVTVALVIVPIVISGLSKDGTDGTDKFILNVSFPSTILSLVTEIFTSLLLVPAAIITTCIVELKSEANEMNNIYLRNLMYSCVHYS